MEKHTKFPLSCALMNAHIHIQQVKTLPEGENFTHKNLPVNETRATIQATFMDEADALFKML